MIFAYMRVSTEEQRLDRQEQALKEAGAEKVFFEKITGTKKNRPQLNKMLEQLRKGDTVIITDLTRLSRSTKDLIELVELFEEKGVNLKSLKESWLDTTTPEGKLMFTMFSGLAQFERDLISQRTKEGLEVARKKGKQIGRKAVDAEALEYAFHLIDKGNSIKDTAEKIGVSRMTLHRYLKKREEEAEQKELVQ
ncbi:recombinase family protein [Mangrovibacillus cuniculi]|uniref:Recombinase family protein n=1 Tax=Mangrovibacillus cuniculi TaxID=2593652 RepID=A0A7S8CCF8_9BACI|nr:recombinase family protein [Mangrovibacillus cuniculi]QPC47367.1 recombinase family protein [Mangrovibacillus cuniculi]